MITLVYVGIDVSAEWFDVFFSSEGKVAVFQEKNTQAGFKQLREKLKRFEPGSVHVCMEHTGRYERALAVFCKKAGFKVSVVDPMKIRSFGRSLTAARVKTDKADAKLIAMYCQAREPLEWEPGPKEYEELYAYVQLREDLIEEKTRCKNQMAIASGSDYVDKARAVKVKFLQRYIKRLEKEILQFVKKHPSLAEAVDLLCTVPGIALVSAVKILALSGPILKYDSAKNYALSAGLNPLQKQSGKKQFSRGMPIYGNKALKSAFYMPTVVNCRKGLESSIGKFIAKLYLEKHKPKKVAIVAGMRKLAHVVYGVLKQGKAYDPSLP